MPVRGIAAASGNVSSARFHFFAVIRTLRVATAVVMGRAAHFRTREVKRRPFLPERQGEPIEPQAPADSPEKPLGSRLEYPMGKGRRR